jgi:hypothetical protein
MEIAVSVLIMRSLTLLSNKPIKRKQILILILIVSGLSLNLIIQKKKRKIFMRVALKFDSPIMTVLSPFMLLQLGCSGAAPEC